MIDPGLAQVLKSDRGRNRGMRGATIAALVLSLATSAAAQAPTLQHIEKHTELCNRVSHTLPEDRIAGCTALIESGAQTTRMLAIAYNNRGNAYFRNGDYDPAIEDYSKSIQADPKYARAFNNRGLAFGKRSDYTRAISDFNQSIKLDPKSAST